jgi:hypothetical protein
MAYETLGKERFVVDRSGPVEMIRIKARRQVFALLFLPVWLTGWTVGGVVAISQVLHEFSLFLCLWLCGWAVGWVFAAGTIAWMLMGAETVRVVGKDLELGTEIGPWKRNKLYQGAQLRDLRAAPANPLANFQMSGPFMRQMQGGAVQFTYGARTVRLAAGLDEAEGKLIVERLKKALPGSATASDGAF